MPKMITGISVDSAIIKKAKAHAKKNRRTFSNYVEGLLIQDLGGPVITSDDHNKKKVVKLKRRGK